MDAYIIIFFYINVNINRFSNGLDGMWSTVELMTLKMKTWLRQQTSNEIDIEVSIKSEHKDLVIEKRNINGKNDVAREMITKNNRNDKFIAEILCINNGVIIKY